jgi:hypothetical protein
MRFRGDLVLTVEFEVPDEASASEELVSLGEHVRARTDEFTPPEGHIVGVVNVETCDVRKAA